MNDLKEKVRLQNDSISQYKITIRNLEKNKLNLREEIDRQDILIYELKKKVPEECSFGCKKYNKSVEEIVTAGKKHKEKLLALKEIADEQKEKIILLRNQKSQLEKQVDKVNDDLEMEKQFILTIQKDSRQKINTLKNELKASEEAKKVLETEKAENIDKYESFIKKNDDLRRVVEKNECDLKMNEEKMEEDSKQL